MISYLTLTRITKFLGCRPITMKISADGKDIPKKKVFQARITLIGTDDSVSITDLKSAQNISTRRELKLVKIQDEDTKTRRPVYKLMTNAEYHEEEISKRKQKQQDKENNFIKGHKLLTLSSRIAEHDLMTRIKKIGKLLEKQFEVRVVITGEESETNSNYDKIYSTIERNLQSNGNLVQKRQKGSALKFQVLPLRKSSSKDSSSNKNDSDGTAI
ncbi:translation initiation factor IF-3, mitochondrial-like [Pieris brassicae]|uniref:translation initiation factor IF-3, mitochondrial-like n=1 Tax=Pieris brassicae TaxID=7116 RepID=UPI001E660836|nr:translation initiation factor IF-3, mitochondrial-like [Pieris brassicae]